MPLGTATVTASSVPPQFSERSPTRAVVPRRRDAGAVLDGVRRPSTFYIGKPYRLHVAAEGIAEPADPPAPRVTVGAPVDRVLDEDDELRASRSACSAACVVRARLDYALDPLDAVVRLPRAGRGTLTFEGAAIVAPVRPGPVRVH